MSEQPEADNTTDEQPVTFELKIRNGQTEIRVSGDRDTAVVVQSESGEKIYLPPEDFDRPAREQTAYESSYRPEGHSQESPYDTGPDADSTVGLKSTTDGYLVVHPEPTTDVRFLR